jgi:hypothetical protein
MGLSLFGSNSFSKYDLARKPDKSARLPNPNPKNYVLLEQKEIGRFLIVKLKYPDCTNYEGTKILLFENTTALELHLQDGIDPHFCENQNFKSPIARFVPTTAGWDMAVKLCEGMLCEK